MCLCACVYMGRVRTGPVTMGELYVPRLYNPATVRNLVCCVTECICDLNAPDLSD